MTSLENQLSELANDFAALTVPERLDLLLEFADNLPEVPERLAAHPDLLERVVESFKQRTLGQAHILPPGTL